MVLDEILADKSFCFYSRQQQLPGKHTIYEEWSAPLGLLCFHVLCSGTFLSSCRYKDIGNPTRHYSLSKTSRLFNHSIASMSFNKSMLVFRFILALHHLQNSTKINKRHILASQLWYPYIYTNIMKVYCISTHIMSGLLFEFLSRQLHILNSAQAHPFIISTSLTQCWYCLMLPCRVSLDCKQLAHVPYYCTSIYNIVKQEGTISRRVHDHTVVNMYRDFLLHNLNSVFASCMHTEDDLCLSNKQHQ